MCRGSIGYETNICLEAASFHGSSSAFEQCETTKSIAEDTDMLGSVKAGLAVCLLQHQSGVEMILELFTMQKSGKEHFECDLARSCWIIG